VAERDDAPLTATAQQTLTKLLARLQRKGDFPAFAQSVGEVSKKADANSAYSASQLGDSILKDYALTAKLLKVVNSMYASRFGGKIYSVQHAIVLLGFDRIRSLALGISLFKGAGKNAQSPYVTDSAISSLVSGEIARALAWNAKLSDEEALVCAMFRNLGRHLVIVYLPEVFEQIVAFAQRDNLHERTAAERVLGISYGKLGVAVAQNWKLPPRMISAIAAAAQTSALTRAEDRVSALSALANDLCDVVATSSATTRSKNIGDLLLRHKQLLTVSEDSVLELLANVQESFQQRYATLGLDVKASRFLNNVGALLQEREARAAAEAEAAQALEPSPEAVAVATSLPAVFGGPAPAAARVDLLERPRQVIAKLNLAKELAADSAGIVLRQIPQPTLEQQIDEVAALLQRRMPVDSVLGHALNTFATQLGVTRLLLLVASSNKDELWVRSGMREDIEAVAKEFKIPLKSRGPANMFAQAYQSGKDVTVTDAFAARTNGAIPVRYYEVLGAPAFGLYSCVGKGLPPVLLLADVDNAEALPSAERVAPLARLRALIAQAAASR
jgi:HD-like signal output (HDOD) protein